MIMPSRSHDPGTYRHVVDTDPEDPTQQLDTSTGFQIEPLAIEAIPIAEAAEDFDLASTEAGIEELEIDDDTGELYGVRTPHAGDTDLSAPEDRDSFDGASGGQSWLEALEEHAALMGPVPEEEIVIVDDSDIEHPAHRGHHATQWRDRPVADKGAGGPGGL